MQALTNEYYGWFVDAVARARGMDAEVVKTYATGEMYPATRAKEIGLIDELGDMETALDMASEMGHVPRRLRYVRPHRPLLQQLLSRNASALTDAVMAEFESRLHPRIDFR